MYEASAISFAPLLSVLTVVISTGLQLGSSALAISPNQSVRRKFDKVADDCG